MSDLVYQIIYQTLGILGAIFNVLSYQCKSNRKLFACQIFASLLFAPHFIMAHAWAGALLNVVCIYRCVFYTLNKNDKYRLFGTISVCVLSLTASLISIFVFKQLIVFAILCGVATIFGSILYHINRGNIIRLGQISVISPIWLVNNIYYHSIGGTLTEIIIIISVVVSFIRHRKTGFTK